MGARCLTLAHVVSNRRIPVRRFKDGPRNYRGILIAAQGEQNRPAEREQGMKVTAPRERRDGAHRAKERWREPPSASNNTNRRHHLSNHEQAFHLVSPLFIGAHSHTRGMAGH